MGLVSSYSAVCYAVPALACPRPIDILTRPEARSFPAEPLEDSPSHMAADLRQTILGDLRIIINDVWDFFAPPLIKFSIALFFFWYICGSAPFYAFNDSVANTASFWDATKITNFFEQYKLTSLLPIAALFVVAIFAYTINRIIFGVAALLPVNIGYSSDRIERMIQEDAMMQSTSNHSHRFPDICWSISLWPKPGLKRRRLFFGVSTVWRSKWGEITTCLASRNSYWYGQ